jgi:hypothetical protein
LYDIRPAPVASIDRAGHLHCLAPGDALAKFADDLNLTGGETL